MYDSVAKVACYTIVRGVGGACVFCGDRGGWVGVCEGCVWCSDREGVIQSCNGKFQHVSSGCVDVSDFSFCLYGCVCEVVALEDA